MTMFMKKAKELKTSAIPTPKWSGRGNGNIIIMWTTKNYTTWKTIGGKSGTSQKLDSKDDSGKQDIVSCFDYTIKRLSFYFEILYNQ